MVATGRPVEEIEQWTADRYDLARGYFHKFPPMDAMLRAIGQAVGIKFPTASATPEDLEQALSQQFPGGVIK